MCIIRPQPGADATAALARQAGIAAEVIPLFEVQSLPWAIPDAANYDALMLTSANALRHGGGGLAALLGLPVYAIGTATAAAARAAGFGVIWTGTDGANALVIQAKADHNLRLLWLSGRHYSNVATPPEISIDTCPVYDSTALAAPSTLIKYLSSPHLTALHSVRAAQHFSSICDTHDVDKSNIAILSYSDKIAAAAGLGWAASLISNAPNDDALLLKAKSYFTNAHRDP